MSELKAKKIAEYTDAEIESFGVAGPGEQVDFSYPEGFFRVANSLTFLPDTQTRVQMMQAFMGVVQVL